MLAALAFVPVAKGASIDLSTKQFSPKIGPLFVNALVGRDARIGVRLSNVNGRVLGWLDPPARRREVQVVWDGTLAGRRVRDGYYQVELVTGGRVAAAAGFRLDSKPARLDHLRISSNSPPFEGDGPLLATLSPNGDGLRDYARIRFRSDRAVGGHARRSAHDDGGDQRVHPHVALPRRPALDRLAACGQRAPPAPTSWR